MCVLVVIWMPVPPEMGEGLRTNHDLFIAHKCVFPDEKVEAGEEKGEPAVAAENCDGNADEELLGPNCYYDKSKSFFDNISSELKQRLVTHGS